MNAAAAEPRTITIDAPAKINLALHVCGRRDDGYHLLDSLVVFAGVGDRISVAPSDTLTLSLTGPFAAGLTADSDNLVLRAARLLAGSSGRGAAITLEKNLPVASGIGGGSSDAAATLIACAAVWNLDADALLAADFTVLGADVPVCVVRRPAVMRGIGEDITALENLPPLWMVLANPGQPLATKTVFNTLRGRFGKPLDPVPPKPDAAGLVEYLEGQRNDLTAPALELMPRIGMILNALAATPGCRLARLSGSGATCFGLYESQSAAQGAAKSLKEAHSSWWVAAAPMLTEPL